MNTRFKIASKVNAAEIAALVIALTEEICTRSNIPGFNINIEDTVKRTIDFIENGFYTVILGVSEDGPVALACVAESYALYAGGKIGIIQEFYVKPEFRSRGIGSKLIDAVFEFGKKQGWACVELCTPPLPEFEETILFYQRQGLTPVGGRKMRGYLNG